VLRPFTAGAPICIKIRGNVMPINAQVLDAAMVQRIAWEIMSEAQVKAFEETLEMIRDKLSASGAHALAGRTIVLTGGAAQLTGLPEVARRILGRNVRVGRHLGISGLPENYKGPAFCASVGLAVYPQVAQFEQFQPRSRGTRATGTDGGYFTRVGAWLRSF
jgi:cell division ATPase FtsA